MAQVSFTIAAIDKTRAAFASVNQGLERIVKGGDATQKKLLTMGLQAVGVGSVFAILGSQVRKVAQDIESVPGVSREVIDSWSQLKAAGTAASDAIGSAVASAGHAIASAGRLAAFAWDVLVSGVDEAQRKVLESDRAMAALRDQGDIDKLTASIERLGKARRDLANVSESEGSSITRRRQEAELLERSALAMTDLVKRNEKLAESVTVRAAAERDFQKLYGETVKLTQDAGMANGRMIGSTLTLTDRIEGLQVAWAAASQEVATYSDLTNPFQLEKRNEALRQQKEIADQLTKAYDEQNRRAADAANVLTRGFEDAVFAGENLRDSIRGIGNDLMRYVFQQLITRPLGNFITGGISSLFGFGGARAMGGPVGAGSSYLVGENGPELFTPSQAGRIIPNHATSQSAGSGGNTYVIDARGTDESVVQRLSSALMQLAGPGVVERRAINATTSRNARLARAT